MENFEKSYRRKTNCSRIQLDFNTCFYFGGNFFERFYSKFDSILKDSFSLVKILENTKFNLDSFLFTVDFESLYTNIPVKDAIEMMKKLVFQFQNVIQNAHFVIELLEIVLKNSLMEFDKEYFQQIFGIIMGTNLAPILANLYLAMLQEELKKKCKHDTKLKWPSLFLRFIDDGFGSMEGTKKCRILDLSIQQSKRNHKNR